jgi:hypothetical protein
MDEKILAIYCLCADFLQALGHAEAPQQKMGFLPNPPIGYIPEILRTNLTWEYPWWPTSK